MTIIHVFNCMIVALVPYFVVYKASKLSEYGAITLSLYAALIYFLTKFAHMIFLATLLPGADAGFSLVQEILKSSAGLFDIVGIYFFLGMSVAAGTSDVKVLATGFGWALAETVLTRIYFIFVGAKSLEFSWEYLASAAEGNLAIAIYISLSVFMFLWSRRGEKTVKIIIGIASYVVYLFIASYLKATQSLFITMLFEFCYTISIGIFARTLWMMDKEKSQ